MRLVVGVFLVGMVGCEADARPVEAPPPVAEEPRNAPDNRPRLDVAPNPGVAPPAAPVDPLTVDDYPWHADITLDTLPATDSLAQRFAPPPGFNRVTTPDHSFGAWLRGLPLAAPGTPVRSFDGNVHIPADHANVAAVTTLDVGHRDLQQCADAVMRLHGEWLWHEGRALEATYPSGGGPIPWKRYLGGGYPALNGNSFIWKNRGGRKNDHASYREYLDVVFSWANTVALARKTTPVARDEAVPGDFFVLAGSPGHAVLILDIAEHADGHRVALLGQSFMPAQSFQVLRPARTQTWFSLNDDEGVKTPFWPKFPWSALHRL
jgi:hypothetical protein